MSGLGFLCLLRDAGDAAALLCADIAAQAQADDEVILVDDSGPGVNFHTTAVVRHFGAFHGWPEGVRVRVISTGVRGAGDEGIAINLALDAARADHLLILPGAARLGPGLAAARALLAEHDLLTCAVMAPDEIAAGTASAQLGRLIFARALADGLRAAEGGDAGGALPLLAGLRRGAERPGLCAEILATLPPLPRISPTWLAQWQAHLPDMALIDEAHQRAAPGTGAIIAGFLGERMPKALKAPLGAPVRLSGPSLRILTPGAHAARSPLSYAALRPLWQNMATAETDPAQADLILFAHPWDVRDMAADVASVLDRAPETPVALLSEEPFWDSLFSPDPLAGQVSLPAAHLGRVMVQQANHHTSPVFGFERIPYFLLTDPAYAARFRRMFARNAALSAQDWRAAFAARPDRRVFMAERRLEPFHDISIPAGGITGLCAWRTRLALACRTGDVARLGSSWQGDAPRRQALEDWHGDKLAQLDGTARIISGLENTHQPLYLSEKLFDAFACRARPLYWAEPSHRLHRMGLPPEAWINLVGQTPDQAAEAIETAVWDDGFYAAYAGAQKALAALWGDDAVLEAERARLGDALRGELLRLAGR